MESVNTIVHGDGKEEKKEDDEDVKQRESSDLEAIQKKKLTKKKKKKKKKTKPSAATKNVLVLLLSQTEPSIRRMPFQEFSKLHAMMGPVVHGYRVWIHVHRDDHVHVATQDYANDFAEFLTQGRTVRGPAIIVLTKPARPGSAKQKQKGVAAGKPTGMEMIIDMQNIIASFVAAMYQEHVDDTVHVTDAKTVVCADHRHEKPLAIVNGLIL
jgi:hypothetical protein